MSQREKTNTIGAVCDSDSIMALRCRTVDNRTAPRAFEGAMLSHERLQTLSQRRVPSCELSSKGMHSDALPGTSSREHA